MAAYNLYRGNGSRAERVEDGGSHADAPRSRPASRAPSAPHAASRQPSLPKLPILGDLPKKLGELESEDLLLILILYLMYRESGDKQLLLIMGAMYLL